MAVEELSGKRASNLLPMDFSLAAEALANSLMPKN